MSNKSTVTRLKEAVKSGREYSAPVGNAAVSTCPSSLLRDLICEEPARGRIIRVRNVTFKGDLDLAHMDWRGTLDLDTCTISGDMNLSHAKIDGRISLSGTTLEMLNLAYADVSGPLRATGLIAKRGLYAVRAHIAGGVSLQRAVLSAPSEDSMRQRAALDMYHSSIGDLYLNRATLRGGLYAIGMTVERNVRLQGSDVYSRSFLGLEQGADAGNGVDLAGSSIGSTLYLTGQAGEIKVNDGTIRLTNASCHNFVVTAATLARRDLDLDGFTYATLSPATGKDLLRVLDQLEEAPFTAYRALSKYAESVGAVSLRRTAVIHLERRITRNEMNWYTPSGAWRRLLDLSVSYGYKPGRALIWLIVCVAVESVILHSVGGFVRPKTGFTAPRTWPQAITLAADSLLPFSTLGYQSNFDMSPSGMGQWWSFTAFAVVKIAAWIMGALGIAAVTGIIRKD